MASDGLGGELDGRMHRYMEGVGWIDKKSGPAVVRNKMVCPPTPFLFLHIAQASTATRVLRGVHTQGSSMVRWSCARLTEGAHRSTGGTREMTLSWTLTRTRTTEALEVTRRCLRTSHSWWVPLAIPARPPARPRFQRATLPLLSRAPLKTGLIGWCGGLSRWAQIVRDGVRDGVRDVYIR